MNKSYISRSLRIMFCIGLMVWSVEAIGQNPTTCSSVGSRSNSNGMVSSCPNVSGTLFASNFAGTAYATVPVSSKTGNFQFNYTGANAGLLPFAITRVWLTTAGTVLQTVAFGPAGVPVVSGGNTQVNYCFYGANLPTAGTLSFELTNPQTGVPWGICSYDASCNSNCAVVSNPAALPVVFGYFRVAEGSGATATLEWSTGQEENNKGFDIQRNARADSSFVSIGFVPSANMGGNSSNPTPYSFTDNNVPVGSDIQYRLRQEDLDGHSYYSMVVAISNMLSGVAPRIYADDGMLHVSLPAGVVSGRYDVLVYDTQGRMIRSAHSSDLSGLTIVGLPISHMYYVAVKESSGTGRWVSPIYIW